MWILTRAQRSDSKFLFFSSISPRQTDWTRSHAERESLRLTSRDRQSRAQSSEQSAEYRTNAEGLRTTDRVRQRGKDKKKTRLAGILELRIQKRIQMLSV